MVVLGVLKVADTVVLMAVVSAACSKAVTRARNEAISVHYMEGHAFVACRAACATIAEGAFVLPMEVASDALIMVA